MWDDDPTLDFMILSRDLSRFKHIEPYHAVQRLFSLYKYQVLIRPMKVSCLEWLLENTEHGVMVMHRYVAMGDNNSSTYYFEDEQEAVLFGMACR
jgi:hypothetical protein